jgi:hypothetical protein
MKRSSQRTATIVLLVLVGLALVGTAALAAADYRILRWTADGGGGSPSMSGGYVLNGSISRYSAENTSQGGNYGLLSGFWWPEPVATQPPPPKDEKLFLPYTTKSNASGPGRSTP